MKNYPMTNIETIKRTLFWKIFFAIVFRNPLNKSLKGIRAHIIFCWNLAKAEVKRRAYLEINTK